MLTFGREGLSELRIKEGKTLEIGGSKDPLDGTWTKSSPAWKKMSLIQRGLGMVFMFLAYSPMIIILVGISGNIWLGLMFLIPLLLTVIGTLALMRWTIKKNYENFRYRITDEELVVESGFLTVNKVLIPLVGIQNVKVIQTWWGKRYGLKNVIVDTAGRSYVPNNPGLSYVGGSLVGLTNADEVADAILSRVKEVKTRNGSRV